MSGLVAECNPLGIPCKWDVLDAGQMLARDRDRLAAIDDRPDNAWGQSREPQQMRKIVG